MDLVYGNVSINKLLAFVLPMRSVSRFPFIHHMTLSLVWYENSELMPFITRSIAVRVLEFAFKMNVQVRL